MAAPSAGDALRCPLYAMRFRVQLPLYKSDGTLVITGTGSSLVSIDGAEAGAGEVPAFIAASGGLWRLDLTAAQLGSALRQRQ